MKRLIFHVDRCTGCRACELACSFVCEGVFAPSLARLKVTRIDEEGLDIPLGCFHCEHAPCMLVCPVRAIGRDKETDAVLIDLDKCIGCKLCAMACPYYAIGFNEERGIVYKCDLCGGDPECVKWCFTGAIEYAEVDEALRRRMAERVAALATAFTEARRLIVPGKG